MPHGAIRTRQEKAPELEQAEREGQDLLHGYCRAQAKNQKALSDATGMLPATVSRMANYHARITFEAAVLIDVATAGQLPAERLCPSRAHLLEQFLQQRTARLASELTPA